MMTTPCILLCLPIFTSRNTSGHRIPSQPVALMFKVFCCVYFFFTTSHMFFIWSWVYDLIFRSKNFFNKST